MVPAWIASIFSSAFISPIVGAAVQAHKNSLDAGNTRESIAHNLAIKELELQVKEAELHNQLKVALIGHWYEPVQLLGYIMVIYVGKVIIWDKVLALGSTDAIGGAVGEWAGAIIMFLIGKRGFENIARIIRK